MREITFGEPVLKVEGLETKFDTVPVSNSLIAVLGSCEEATIVQLIHSWILEGQGVVIDGNPWFNKSIKDWIAEAFPTISTGKMRSYLSSLAKKGVLERKQLYKEHYGHNYSPKNRTYYYRLDYDGLSKLFTEAINLQNLDNDGGAE
jgi:hypothetical protein